MKKFLAFFLFLCVTLIAISFKSFTVPIFSQGSIAQLVNVIINDDQQTLLIRGVNQSNPIVLFLHGGPGMPAMFLGHQFQQKLETEFVVVHWDQRAAGKSFKEGADPKLISTSQLVKDALAVVEYLNEKFPNQAVYLLGHSHGSYLGAILAANHPEKFSAYIGVGQVADESKTVALQDAFLTQTFPGATVTTNNREDLLFQAGAEIYGETSFMSLLIAGILAPEYSLNDVINVKRGSSFSSRNMNRDLIDGSLMNHIQEFKIPIYFIMGEHNMVTPTELAERYFNLATAPRKKFISIRNASHFPFLSQTQAFSDAMLQIKNESSSKARD